jgi:hypothetical protein
VIGANPKSGDGEFSYSGPRMEGGECEGQRAKGKVRMRSVGTRTT